VTLPLEPPLKPQLALTRKQLPLGEEWAYEQKLDGFRAIVFVDGAEAYIQSRGGKALSRYFPELSFPPGRYVLDGELVIRDTEGNLEFDALQSRIHPAESRIALLAREIPADYVAFDLLAEGDESLLDSPFGERRARLEALGPAFTVMDTANAGLVPASQIEVSMLSPDPARAEEWLAHTEGTMAKQLDAPYLPGKRKGMAKVKREREIDCVVMGWRPGKEEGTVGSLILGLYDGDALRPVGHISGFSAEAKRGMRTLLEPLETGDSGTAEPSRWSGGRDLQWVALRPELVIEVGYDHAAAGRIRHGARFRRFRDDKDPRECTFESLDQG
jgi:ATP-dependent DNA ligase